MDSVPVKINEWLIEGFETLKNHAGLLIAASAIGLIVSVASLGVLAGPMLAGLIMIILALPEGRERPSPLDVFKGLKHLVQSFLFFFFYGLLVSGVAMILGRLPLLGQLFSVAWSLGLASLLMLAMFLIVDRKESFVAASLGSVAMVRRNLGPFLGFGIMASVIGHVGIILLGIGVVVTLPLSLCMVAVAYREVFLGVETERAALVSDEKPLPPELVASGEEPGKAWEISEEELRELEKDQPSD